MATIKCPLCSWGIKQVGGTPLQCNPTGLTHVFPCTTDVKNKVIDASLVDWVISIDWEYGHVECSAKYNEGIPRIFSQFLKQKIYLEKLAMASTLHRNSAGSDSEQSAASEEAEVSPSRSSICSELFFGNGELSGGNGDLYNSNISLDGDDSRKSSMTESELEFRLKNEFKDSNCVIS